MDNIPIPNDSLSERGVLGSMILNGDIADEISEIIEPSDFFNPNNMSIFESILVMRNEEKNVDEIKSALERDNFMTADVAQSFGLIDEVVEKRS